MTGISLIPAILLSPAGEVNRPPTSSLELCRRRLYNPPLPTTRKDAPMHELLDYIHMLFTTPYLWKILSTPFEEFMKNPVWEAIGFLGQAVFFGRFIIQWVASERKKRTVVPVAFWYMSLIGGFITLLYAIHVGRLVFIMAFSLSSIIYIRNLVIYYKRRSRRKGLVFASGPELGEVPDEPDADESTD
jgi:lipid-A-disaccharide synthase-like uncharacterized protein